MDPGRNGSQLTSGEATATASNRLWLSHHHDHQRERCMVIADTLVCRRCVVLYPLAIVVACFVGLAAAPPDEGSGISAVLVALMWACPLPAVLEWAGEHTGHLYYSAARQVLTTALAAVALGVAFAQHLRTPFSFAVMAPLLLWTFVAAAIAWVTRSSRHRDAADGWLERHDSDEEDRAQRLRAALRLPER